MIHQQRVIAGWQSHISINSSSSLKCQASYHFQPKRICDMHFHLVTAEQLSCPLFRGVYCAEPVLLAGF